MTSPQKKFKSKNCTDMFKETQVFLGFEGLSSSISWRIMAGKV